MEGTWSWVMGGWGISYVALVRPSVFVGPVGSFVAEAVHSPQGPAPVVHSFADPAAPSLLYMPTLHVVGKY